MTGDTGHPTWLHSTSTCPHPHVHIISCPTFSNRDAGVAPNITTASMQTTPACIQRLYMMYLSYVRLRFYVSPRCSPCQVGHQCKERPKHHDPNANPDP